MSPGEHGQASGARYPVINTTASRWRRASFWLAVAGLIALAFADLEIARSSPGSELLRMGQGFLAPDFFSTDNLWRALANTLAFAWQGTALAAPVSYTHLTLPTTPYV